MASDCILMQHAKERLVSFFFDLLCVWLSRSPALIGCFVVDRQYFAEIGLLDEGMEIYGGENVELGVRVRNVIIYRL